MEVPIGGIVVVEDELIVRMELFEIDDRPAMLARYEELGGGGDPAGLAGSSPSKRAG